MTQADGPLLIVGLLFLALTSCGVLTGCPTTRSNSSFAANPIFWSVGIGMQTFLAIYCLLSCGLIAKLLGMAWLQQSISITSVSNKILLLAVFIVGSSICGALCFGARKFVLACQSGRNSESLKHNDAALLPQQSNLIQVTYSKSDRVFYGMLTLCFSAIFAMMSYATIHSFPWQWQWSSTTGVITEIRQNAKAQNVDYSYSADNRRFTATEQFHWHGLLLHKGDPVVVRYDPAVVVRSAIETGPTIATGLWVLASALALIGGISQFNAPTGPAIGVRFRLY